VQPGRRVSGPPVRWKWTVPDLAQAGRVAQCHWSVSRNRPDGFDFFLSNFWFSSKLCKVQNFV
jgi:hypothetical protein